MSDTHYYDFEQRGYHFEALKTGDAGEAIVRITKDGKLLRETKWPAYKVWNIQAHADDIIDGLEHDKDTGLRAAGSNGLGGGVYGKRTLSERLTDTATDLERATAQREDGVMLSSDDEVVDDPEGTVVVKMSHTIRGQLVRLLREAGNDIQQRNVQPRHECEEGKRADEASRRTVAAERERDEFAALMHMSEGPDGEPASRAKPADLKSYIDQIQGEWDDAERGKARLQSSLKMSDEGYNEMRNALALVLPLAKGYAATNPHESNDRYCQSATDLLDGRSGG